MEAPNLGNEGCWTAALLLAILGVITAVYMGVRFAVWLVHHVHVS